MFRTHWFSSLHRKRIVSDERSNPPNPKPLKGEAIPKLMCASTMVSRHTTVVTRSSKSRTAIMLKNAQKYQRPSRACMKEGLAIVGKVFNCKFFDRGGGPGLKGACAIVKRRCCAGPRHWISLFVCASDSGASGMVRTADTFVATSGVLNFCHLAPLTNVYLKLSPFQDSLHQVLSLV